MSLRLLGNLQGVQCRAPAGSLFDAADVADQMQQAASPFDLCRFARGARYGRETGLPDHAAETLGELGTQPSGLARGLHKRKPSARGSSGPKRRIGASGNCDAGCRKTQNQLVHLLAADIPRAFAQGVTDIAKYEQVA